MNDKVDLNLGSVEGLDYASIESFKKSLKMSISSIEKLSMIR